LFDLATQSPHKDGIVTKLQEGLTKSDRTLLGMLAPNLYDLIENDKSPTEHSHLELARCKVCNLQDRQVQSVCVTVLQILTTEFQRPVVLLWEDLHWASAALLDFIKHILVADVTYLALFTYVTSKNSSNHGLTTFSTLWMKLRYGPITWKLMMDPSVLPIMLDSLRKQLNSCQLIARPY
jgi:predicted ATPase